MPYTTNFLIGMGIPELKKTYEFSEGSTKITTPQSVNLDLQTGIMANTQLLLHNYVGWIGLILLFAHINLVKWLLL